MMFIVIYLVLALMVAILARKTRMGFFRGLLFSIMFTPILSLLFLLILSLVDSDDPKKISAKLVSRIIRKT